MPFQVDQAPGYSIWIRQRRVRQSVPIREARRTESQIGKHFQTKIRWIDRVPTPPSEILEALGLCERTRTRQSNSAPLNKRLVVPGARMRGLPVRSQKMRVVRKAESSKAWTCHEAGILGATARNRRSACLLGLKVRFGKNVWRNFPDGHSAAPNLELAHKRSLDLIQKTMSRLLADFHDKTRVEKRGHHIC